MLLLKSKTVKIEVVKKKVKVGAKKAFFQRKNLLL